MRKLWSLFIMVATVMTSIGCVTPPILRNPGSERWQQARAQRFDPYPENFPGMPSVTGTRPREFSEPRAEVLSVQPRKGEPIYGPYAPAPGNAPPQVQAQPCP